MGYVTQTIQNGVRVIERLIDNFDGGIVNDPRITNENVCQMATNLDVFTNPHKLTPYRDTEAGDVNVATNRIRNYAVGLRDTTNNIYSLFGLGKVSGQTYAKVYYKDLTTGAATDLDEDDWASTSDNASASLAVDYRLFVYYRKTGKFYGARGGTSIWAYLPSGTPAFTEQIDALTYTDIAQGLVASDDILYIPYHNSAGPTSAIASKNNTVALNATALTLPSHLKPTSICQHGNYLAIGCVPVSGVGNSKVFLWDRSSTSWNEQIDWGNGSLMVLDSVDGILVGISQKGGVAQDTAQNPIGTTSFKDKVFFRYLNGNQAVKFLVLTGGANTTYLPIAKQKIDNRLFFLMSINLNGTTEQGIWSVGRSSPSSPMALVHEYVPNNGTALTGTNALYGFYILDDYVFLSYLNNSTESMDKTLSTAAYLTESIYITQKFNGGDISYIKDLVGVTVMTEPLPSTDASNRGQVVLQYRVDATTTWTTIFTQVATTSSDEDYQSLSYSAVTDLPKAYKEIQFRIKSLGGAEVTGLHTKEQITSRKNYE